MRSLLRRALPALIISSACAAGQDDGPGAGGSGASGGSGAGTNVGGSGAFSQGGSGGSGGFEECATFVDEAAQAPAAMLVVLDKSASMNTNNKWSTAQLAVVSAIDQDAFDSMSLGLVTFPSSFTQPPQCLCDYCCGGDPGICSLVFPMGVSCGVSGLPQVALAPAGTQKSNEGGVRKSIYDYLVTNAPLSNGDDGSPIYEALVSGYNALKAYDIDQRILVLVTDGGFSCTSVATPARPGYSDGACNDWEYPDSVNTLITQHRTDPTKPIYTFIVGLPGSNSTGQNQGNFATAPYHMKRALSSYAFNGSPETVDPTCDVPDPLFNTSGPDPAVPCHFDLTVGSFSPDVLAGAIAQIRGTALGCVYALPEPPPGETIDFAKVNVDLTLDGTKTRIPKRANPSDACDDDAGCWDYTAENQVELIGKACGDVTSAAMAKVEIVVGCDTIIK